MGKIGNTPKVNSLDAYSKDEWVDFLKKGAYRGLKINKVARHIGKSKSCTYDKVTHELELIYGKGKTITLDMEKLLKKNERWTLSRLIHNIKMCVSTDYELDFKIRIEKLADAITKKTESDFSIDLETFVHDDHDLSEIKTFFNHNLRMINESSGNKKIQSNLLKLSEKASESPELAFQIQCTANAMVIDPNQLCEALPSDIQKLILSELYFNEGNVNQPLNLVSKQFSQSALQVNKTWINHDEICLKKQGCKTAKEAVQYIIDHQLTSANLFGFHDVDDEDLNNLSNNCKIKKLFINCRAWDEINLLTNLKKFTDLKSFGIKESVYAFPWDQLVEIAKMHAYIEDFEIESGYLDKERLMEAIEVLSDLKSLVVYKTYLDADMLIQIAKKHPNLKRLEFTDFCSNNSFDQIMEIATRLPKLQHLNVRGYFKTSAHIEKIATVLPNLQSFSFASSNQYIKMAKALPGLKKLEFGDSSISSDQIISVGKLLPHLRNIKISTIQNISDTQLVEIANSLPNLLSFEVSKCTQSDKDRLEEALKHLPKINIKVNYLAPYY